MGTGTSSARYIDLYDYARDAEQLDHDIVGQGDKLTARLVAFEATCREGGLRVGGNGLGLGMRSYGVGALPIDQNVRAVGERFQRADACWAPPVPATTPMIDPEKKGFNFPGLSWMNLLKAGGWIVNGALFAGYAADYGEQAAKALSWFFMDFNPSKVPGTFGVSASGWARQLWGLDARYAKGTTIANTMFGFRHALSNVGVLSVVALIPASVAQIKANYQQYGLDPLGMVAATVIDLEVIAATSIVASAGGAKIGSVIGGAVGTLIAPGPGTAAGMFIGGLAGGAGGAYLARKFQDSFFSSEFRQDLIGGISQAGYQLADDVHNAGKQLIEATGEKIQDLSDHLAEKANELVDFTDSAVDQVTGFFGSKVKGLGDLVDKKAGELINGNDFAPAI